MALLPWKNTTALFVTAGLSILPAVFAQQTSPAAGTTLKDGEVPIYRTSVTEYAERTTKAVNYRYRGGATKVDFEGTSLLQKANGEAKVESKQGYMEIEAEFDDMTPAKQFGREYLTYVMWAITPEGRATNLGEILLNGNRSKLNVTTELQAFSLLVTAEPYFAVTMPSDVIVLENVVRPDTRGKVETVDAKFELLKRGSYSKNITDGTWNTKEPDDKIPLEALEADNAIKLVRAAGAEKYAKETFDKAVASQEQAWRYLAVTRDQKRAIMTAREAVQVAEDARLITVQRQEEERLAAERRAAEARTNQANLAAAQAADRARVEEQNRRSAERDAALAAQRADQELQARRAADTARAEAEQARVAAEAARAEAAREREAADKARALAIEAQQAAQKDAAEAKELAAKAERERAEIRERLQQQLNAVLETKQSARGLIATMQDVLFDVGQATLKPGAREKLAKVSGILASHPDLMLQLEGHTDSTGSDELNQRLSENRAAAARDFLVSQGIPAANITARGFGESQPVASNDTTAGRQQNRRVELVISGASIGQGASSTAAVR